MVTCWERTDLLALPCVVLLSRYLEYEWFELLRLNCSNFNLDKLQSIDSKSIPPILCQMWTFFLCLYLCFMRPRWGGVGGDGLG